MSLTQKKAYVMSGTATASSASMTAAIVNPIIAATKDTFSMMFDSQVQRKQLALKTTDIHFHDLNAVIGLSGDASGSICISVANQTAFEAVRRILDMEVDTIDRIVTDTVGEIANVIAGSAKDRIQELHLELGIPNVIRGQNVQIDFPLAAQPMYMTFETDLGDLMIVFGFVSH